MLPNTIKYRKNNAVFPAIVILIALNTPIFALNFGGDNEDAGHAGSFLDFAASARSLSMGRAYTAISDDAGATYWNPSGLTQLRRNNLVTLYTPLEDDSNFGFLSYAQPTVKRGSFGFSFVSLNSGGFEKRDALGQVAGEAKLSEMAFLLSHAFKFSQRLSMGNTLKSVQQRVDGLNATGYGFDTGLMYQMGSKWQAGFSIKNVVAPKLTLQSKAESLARDMRLGLQFAPTSKITLAADAIKNENRATQFTVGTEFQISPLLALRGGINETEISAGLGFQIGNWGLDYAFANATTLGGVDALSNSHRFGFNLQFGKTVMSRKEEIVRRKHQEKSGRILVDLRKKMNLPFIPQQKDIEGLLIQAEQAIKHQGFTNASDLYEAQGYIYFLKKKFAQSVYYIGEALNIAGTGKIDLKKHYEKALSFMNKRQKEVEAERLLKVAIEHFEKKQWRMSLQYFDKVLMVDPNNQEALTQMEYAKKYFNDPIKKSMQLAKQEYNNENYLGSIKHLQNVRVLDPNHEEAMNYMQRAIKKLEKSQGGVYETSVVSSHDVNPTESRKLYSQGLQLYSQGQLSKAMEIWHRAVKLDPKNKGAFNAYQRVYSELNGNPNKQFKAPVIKKEEKRKEIIQKNKKKKVIELNVKTEVVKKDIILDKELSTTLYKKGLSYYSQGKLEDALSAWKKSLEYNKKNTVARSAYRKLKLQLRK